MWLADPAVWVCPVCDTDLVWPEEEEGEETPAAADASAADVDAVHSDAAPAELTSDDVRTAPTTVAEWATAIREAFGRRAGGGGDTAACAAGTRQAGAAGA